MPKDRAYDPARRPNIFYKNDPASNAELEKRAYERGEAYKPDSKKTTSEHYSENLGYDMGMSEKDKDHEGILSGTITKKGKSLKGGAIRTSDGVRISGATNIRNLPVDGSALARGKAIAK